LDEGRWRKGYQESRITGQQENWEVRIKNGFGIKACPACPVPNRLLPLFGAGSKAEWVRNEQSGVEITGII